MIGFKIRKGGGLPEKIFGVFSTVDPDAEDAEQVHEEYQQAQRWAAKQNKECQMLGKPFTFVAYVPTSEEEEKALLLRYYETARDSKLLYA